MDFTDLDEMDFALQSLGSVIMELEREEVIAALQEIFTTYFTLDTEEISVIPGDKEDYEFYDEVEEYLGDIWSEFFTDEQVQEVLEEGLDPEDGYFTEDELFQWTVEIIASGLEHSESFKESLELEPLPERNR